MENKILLRILLIGKTEVGKTCIMLKYINNIFLSEYIQTIVVDCRSKSNLILGNFSKICIFDSPGNEEFSTLTPAYWHLADIIIFVAAYKDAASFEFVKNLESIIFQKAQSGAIKAILLNKKDLKDDGSREDNEFEESVKLWAEKQSVQFYQCSVKEDDESNVNDTIEKVIDKFIRDKIDPEAKKLGKSQVKKKWKCQIF